MPLAEFHHAGLRILGHSLAGVETYVFVPELNIAFDFGRAPQELVGIDHVFLSHGHTDHSAGLVYYCAQRLFLDNEPGHIYLPEALLEPARELLRVWGRIDGQEPPAHLHAARPGEDLPVRRNLIVRPFRVNHPSRRRGGVIDSLGYAAIEVRHKLRDEYLACSGQEIVELKRRGVEVTRRVELPLVTYCGDTAPGEFLSLDYVRKAQILVIECTFVEEDHQDRASAGAHMHLSELARILPQLENERIILTHLSRRTTIREAKRLLRSVIGDALDTRVFLLMDLRRRGRRAEPLG